MNDSKVTPKDFFLHLGSAVGLYVSAVSLINLLFDVINYAFPDSLTSYVDPYSSAVRWSIAMLLIFFPLYLLISWGVSRDMDAHPEKRSLWIRKWLAYLTLFVAGVTIAIDLVVLINSFLGGELTTRFLLKVIAVLVIAGAVFGYYLFDLRRDVGVRTVPGKIFAYGAVVLIFASLVCGFLVMGSPTTARNMKFDDQRVSDLGTIQWQVVDYWQRTEKLPANLDALKDPLTGFVVPTDPVTKQGYEYQATGKLSFSLCATFSLASVTRNSSVSQPYPSLLGENDSWQHAVGRVCFNRTIDPSRYPPRSQTQGSVVPPVPKPVY